ncbi:MULTISPECIES: aminodeoxychorismate synthase component I [unclassified Lysobacter]|uniref:aminodeoxychorismate synthase component I n=1 Tax=unclassified Lysobacter TaxID=2635362 RepID=UPI001BE7C71F|nr:MULTISPECIES: aminodeoxychorismate synthase component I [unclassified Lysobacter]MBT2750106.1 aminodeoxychorismate synthase component I [Lysobacter sp. ISL-50]MBT2775322.1 aminodeoxychorismate synthase component I [Lysobacter sp. ISL-54]MBT2783445.1 aminodeoxychorismate synthase component I [Lysobacter sp. ISL-52]
MRCLLIDNHDSFTWNLADQIGRAFGDAPRVVRNDDYRWDELQADARYDCIVISPGPGSVTRDADFHVSRQAIERSALPLLGVCLGFQGIAHAYGGRIAHAPEPVHGRSAAVMHDGSDLFAGLPSPLQAVRYHSLIAAAPLPAPLLATAHSDDGLIMALRHRQRPQWGMQFHPESILTEHGIDLIANFRDLARRHHGRAFVSMSAPEPAPAPLAPPPPRLRVLQRPLAGAIDPEAVFSGVYAQARNSFWLDSQIAEDAAACSFMGAVEDADLHRYRIADDDEAMSAGQALLALLEGELEADRVIGGEALPFDFRGGFVGYFGYEMKALFDGERGAGTTLPDAVWMRVRRFVAFDHAERRAWAVAIVEDGQDDAARQWLDATCARIESMHPASAPSAGADAALRSLDVEMDLGRADYLAAIDACRRAIVDGESYQVCLTNHFRFRAALDPLALYRQMRRGNAAPFGAYLRCGDSHVLSTSPERFLRVNRDGRIQTKPIKGTIRRSKDPQRDAQYAQRLAHSDKDRAENLMIVDLMRNDLNRVAVPATVEVPKLREIESYRTVHQLVSTVEAQLRPDRSLIDLLRATFPGGSISGAPKQRTMQIIDRLERSARGVYCGSIGYLGYNRVADLNIGIRTLSYDGDTVAFGAGGAITWLSDAQDEFQEVLLKAEAVLRPLWRHLAANEGFAYQVRGDRLHVHAAASASDG